MERQRWFDGWMGAVLLTWNLMFWCNRTLCQLVCTSVQKLWCWWVYFLHQRDWRESGNKEKRGRGHGKQRDQIKNQQIKMLWDMRQESRETSSSYYYIPSQTLYTANDFESGRKWVRGRTKDRKEETRESLVVSGVHSLLCQYDSRCCDGRSERLRSKHSLWSSIEFTDFLSHY